MTLGFIFSFIALFFYGAGLILVLLIKLFAGVAGSVANRNKQDPKVVQGKLAYSKMDLLEKQFLVDKIIFRKEMGKYFGRELQQIYGENGEEEAYKYYKTYRKVPMFIENYENWFAKILLAREGKGDVVIKPTFDRQNFDKSVAMIKCIEDAWRDYGYDFHLVFRKIDRNSDTMVAEIDEIPSRYHTEGKRMW